MLIKFINNIDQVNNMEIYNSKYSRKEIEEAIDDLKEINDNEVVKNIIDGTNGITLSPGTGGFIEIVTETGIKSESIEELSCLKLSADTKYLATKEDLKSIGNVSAIDVNKEAPEIDVNISSGGTGSVNSIGVFIYKESLEEPVLKIYGHEKLIEQGYVPYIWRYITKTCKKWDPVEENFIRYRRKGWCTYGSYHCVNITEDGIVEFSTNPSHKLNSPAEEYSPNADAFAEFTNDSGMNIRHGNRAVKQYGNVRIKYAIGFARKKHLREKLSEADLVSNLAKFYITNYGDSGIEKFTFGLSREL